MVAFLPTLFSKYRVAGRLPVGPPLPPKLFEIAVGLILGDVHIYRNKKENASLHIEQSIKKKEYLLHLFELFEDYCKSTPVTRTRVDKKTGNDNSAIRFTTRQLSCFTQLHELFYVNKVKIVPINIEELLTSVSLAYWAMDDGNKQGKGFHFNTNSYTLEEVELLSKVLLNKFNLNNSIHPHKNGYRIYIKSNSMNQFRLLVLPYFHSSMLYKLEIKD